MQLPLFSPPFLNSSPSTAQAVLWFANWSLCKVFCTRAMSSSLQGLAILVIAAGIPQLLTFLLLCSQDQVMYPDEDIWIAIGLQTQYFSSVLKTGCPLYGETVRSWSEMYHPLWHALAFYSIQPQETWRSLGRSPHDRKIGFVSDCEGNLPSN